VLADEPNFFADEVCRLLDSPRERKRIGDAARRIVEEKYSWAAVAGDVESVLRLNF